MTILYKVHNNLYVNLTNKCPCSCTFCLRQTMDHVGESDSLWLTREPEYEEIIADFANFNVDALMNWSSAASANRQNASIFCSKLPDTLRKPTINQSVSTPTDSATLSTAETLHQILKG